MSLKFNDRASSNGLSEQGFKKRRVFDLVNRLNQRRRDIGKSDLKDINDIFSSFLQDSLNTEV